MAFAVSLALGLVLAGQRGFWHDEAGSLFFARQPLSDIHAGLDPYNPPLYFAFLHLWIRAFGEGELVCRLPSIFAAAACAAYITALAWDAGGRRAGLAAAALSSLSPGLLVHAAECRPYAFLALWSCATLSSWLRFRRDPRRLSTFVLSAALATGLLLHYTAAFVVAVLLGASLLSGHRRLVLRTACAAVGAIAFTLWVHPAALTAVVRISSVAAGPPVSPVHGAFGPAYIAFSMIFGETLLPWRWPFVLPPAIAAGGLALLTAVRWRQVPHSIRVAAATTSLAVTATGLSTKASPHYALVALPLFLLAAAWAISSLHGRFLPTAAFIVLCSGAALSAGNAIAGRDYHNMAMTEPHDQIAADVRRSLSADDCVVYLGNESLASEYYLHHDRTAVAHWDPARGPTVRLGRTETPFDDFFENATAAGVWLVLNSTGQNPSGSEIERLQARASSYLDRSRYRIFHGLYGFDPDAHEKERRLGKPFRKWRVEVIGYREKR